MSKHDEIGLGAIQAMNELFTEIKRRGNFSNSELAEILAVHLAAFTIHSGMTEDQYNVLVVAAYDVAQEAIAAEQKERGLVN